LHSVLIFSQQFALTENLPLLTSLFRQPLQLFPPRLLKAMFPYLLLHLLGFLHRLHFQEDIRPLIWQALKKLYGQKKKLTNPMALLQQIEAILTKHLLDHRICVTS